VLSSDSEQELQSDFPQVESSKSRGKKPVPAIRDLDWSQLDDQEAEDLINYYNPATDGVPSPQLIAHNIVAPGPGLMERPAEDNNDTHRGLDDLQARKIDPQTLMRRWLNNQDFTQELADFHANEVWEQHRRAQRLEEARCRFEELFAQQKKRAEEVAKQQEEDRRQAEELAKQQQEEEDARLAAERARLRDCVVCGDSKVTTHG
jgi:predicted ribosome quality control (RQC) complex YloA/Tae2 family protein